MNPKKRHGARKTETTAENTSRKNEFSLLNDPFVCISLIIIIAFISYLNSVNVPFVFDDYPYLVENPLIRSFNFFIHQNQVFSLPIDSDVKNNFILRPVSYFTFAINFALHGYDVRGYHIVNLLIHIGNAIFVYILAALTLHIADANDGVPPSARRGIYPLICALIFVAHPLQTQAVTYTVQRFTSLVTLFFLVALATYILSRRAKTVTMQRSWYALCLAATFLAMNSKENAFMLPIVIGMYEFIFFNGPITKRVLGLMPVITTMVIIPYKLQVLSSVAQEHMKTGIANAINIANFKGTSSAEYLATQFGVIVSYIRLLLAPVRQNLLHDLPLQKDFFAPQVMLPLMLLLLLIAFGVWALNRSGHDQSHASSLKIVAFGIFWFFITLAVESSVVPLDDLMFEHRVYLPSVGFILATFAGTDIIMMKLGMVSPFSTRISVVIICFLVSCSVVATIARNRTWGEEISLWNDVVRKSPGSSNAHNALGVALARPGGDSMRHFASIPALDGDIKLTARESQLDSAIREFRRAIELNPSHEKAQINLGIALIDRGKLDEAIAVLQHATRSATGRYPALPYLHIGRAYAQKGDYNTATASLNRSIEIDPLQSRAFEQLGEIHARKERFGEALAAYEHAYRLAPEEILLKKIIALKKRL